MKRLKNYGFTLIELLVVISIIGMIVGVSLPNFLGARERARDTKRKAEMQQLKTALRLYYNDYGKYPPTTVGGLSKIAGCGADGKQNCPCNATVDFAAGGAGCDMVYMKKFPSDYGTKLFYYQVASGDDFRLSDTLENASDSDIATSQSRCPSAGGSSCAGNTYCVCSE